MGKYLKDPEATSFYGFDLASGDWLEEGETIVASSWTIPAGLTKVSESFHATDTTVWISGGTVGTTYTIVNHFKTSAGREDDRSHQIIVRNR